MILRVTALIVTLAFGVLAPLAVDAQGRPKILVIGMLGTDPVTLDALWKAFRARLRELGCVGSKWRN